MKGKKNYGRTIDGQLITDELIEKLVKEAEEGWDVEELIRQGNASVCSPTMDGEIEASGPPRKWRSRRA